jgi:hypothetical protein
MEYIQGQSERKRAHKRYESTVMNALAKMKARCGSLYTLAIIPQDSPPIFLTEGHLRRLLLSDIIIPPTAPALNTAQPVGAIIEGDLGCTSIRSVLIALCSCIQKYKQPRKRETHPYNAGIRHPDWPDNVAYRPIGQMRVRELERLLVHWKNIYGQSNIAVSLVHGNKYMRKIGGREVAENVLRRISTRVPPDAPSGQSGPSASTDPSASESLELPSGQSAPSASTDPSASESLELPSGQTGPSASTDPSASESLELPSGQTGRSSTACDTISSSSELLQSTELRVLPHPGRRLRRRI